MNDDEETVFNKLSSAEMNDGFTCDFPKLSTCCCLELLICAPIRLSDGCDRH